MKIGILGGTFDPVHNAHLSLANAAQVEFALDEVWLMPAKIPPHKQGKEIASDENRLAMLWLATEGSPKLRVKTLELYWDKVSYTYETLAYLAEHFPENEYFYIMGEDSLRNFDSWYHPKEICSLATILVARRDNADGEAFARQLEEKKWQYGNRFEVLPVTMLPYSSSEIRRCVLERRSVDGMLPECVTDYIRSTKLYKKDYVDNLEAYKKRLQESLSEKRYVHCRGVAFTAAELAVHYHCSVEEAFVAGWLHDCAKEYCNNELLHICEVQKITVTKDETYCLQLLHGKVGAYLAETHFGVENASILSAIRYHVTGRPEMTLLEKIIFVSDYIEPSRTQKCDPPLFSLRQWVYRDIDECVLLITKSVLSYLEHKNAFIDEMSVKTKEYYENLCEKQRI